MAAQEQTPFCRIPWHSLTLSPYGGIGVCCMIPGNLGEVPKGASLNSAWSGADMKSFRQEQRQHQLSRACLDCKTKEGLGIEARKNQLNGLFARNPQLAEFYQDEPSWEHLYHLELSFSNKCNLKCLFCYSGNSNSWFQDRDELVRQDPDFFSEPLGMTRTVFDPDADVILPFIDQLKNLQELEIKGGEPFLAKAHRPLLEKLIENGRASQLHLLYTTNGTVFDPKFLELWKHFKQVELSVSVDGLGSVYRYIRGGRYSFETDVLPSVRLINEHPEIPLNFHFTACAYNLLELPRFLSWLENSGLSASLSLGLCEYPAFLSLSVLPREIRSRVVGQLAPFQHRPEVRNFTAGLLQRDDGDADRLRHEFYYYTQSVDRVRKRRMLDFIPELSDFYLQLGRAESSKEIQI